MLWPSHLLTKVGRVSCQVDRYDKLMLPIEPSTSALLRMRHYMRSAGRYGNSPFLMGHYGGLGEMVQGFCR